MRKTSIKVPFQKKGIHCYPKAPDQVAYLRNPHRHVFQFIVKIQVFTDDRDIEFHMFQTELEDLYSDGILELDYKACEMMANELIDYIEKAYPDRTGEVEVSEDGECAAIVEF